MALGRHVSLLGEDRSKFKDLLKVIFRFRFDWLMQTDSGASAILESYEALIINLVSSNSCFVPPACQMLAKALVFSPMSIEESTELDTVTELKRCRNAMCRLVRNVIRRILALVPSAHAGMQQALRDNFPHALKDVDEQLHFISNLLHLCRQIPEMNEYVIGLIVDKVVKIDVQVSRLDALNTAAERATPAAAVGSENCPPSCDDGPTLKEKGEDGNDNADRQEPVQQENDEEDEDENGSLRDRKEVEKLDKIMHLLFSFLRGAMRPRRRVEDKKKKEDEQEDEQEDEEGSSDDVSKDDAGQSDRLSGSEHATKEMFVALLRAFRSTVIHTHQTTCVQYLVFFAAQFDRSLPSTFIGLLLDAIPNDALSDALRMTCVCYCASFVSRATYIDIQTVRAALSFLTHWLRDYISHQNVYTDKNRSLDEKDDAKRSNLGSGGLYVTNMLESQRRANARHAVFRCAVQALLYALCFVAKPIAASSGGSTFLKGLGIVDLLTNKNLHPLSGCLPDVLIELRRVVGELNCWSPALMQLLDRATESKSSFRMREENGLASQGFETFFPFDPYLLSSSGSKFVDPIYRKWEEVASDEEEEDGDVGESSDESVDDGEEEDDDDEDRYRRRLARAGLSERDATLVPTTTNENELDATFERRKLNRSRSRGFSFDSTKRDRKRRKQNDSFDEMGSSRREESLPDRPALRPRLYSFDEILSRQSAPRRVAPMPEDRVTEGSDPKSPADSASEDTQGETLTFLAGAW
eukprot:g2527.t1